MCGRHFARFAASLAVILGLAAAAHAQVVFSTDFNGAMPAELTAQGCQLEPVQGYANLGAPGNQFGGNLLRYHAQTLYDTTLDLTGLPAHATVSLGFLLAVIDSWDGTELFEVLVDGQTVFSNWFQLATGDASSYVAPTGGLLSSGTNRGWSSGSYYNHDRAYDLSLEPAFQNIPHSASTLTVTIRMGAVSGGAAQNWQGEMDESWGIDNLTVTLGSGASAAPLPTAGAARLLGNAPNPFNPSTTIAYELPAAGAAVRLVIYDLAGRQVRTLVDGDQAGGRQFARWDGRDDAGQGVPAGVYLYRVSASGDELVGKMVLVK